MLDTHKKIVQATVPVLQQYGEAITQAFYQQLFEAHPELFNVFNPANQRDGGQARSLAASILAYAAHIDKLDQLGGMVNKIAHKHVSLEVLPEHYPIVGKHLLGAIKTVLGDAATPEIIDAWAAAYGQLADIMITHEESLFSEDENKDGGWRGYKAFTVLRKHDESETITSFYLTPVDGALLPDFKPGQYLGIKLRIPGAEYEQRRQYSLSHTSDRKFYRISVKREPAPQHHQEAPEGQISNYLCNTIDAGDQIDVSMPSGTFVLDDHRIDPVVLLSGGVGITPAICILQQLAQQGTRQVLFVHATLGRAHHAFADELRELVKNKSNLKTVIYYENISPDDVQGVHHDELGWISLASLRPYLPSGPADFYYCGPLGFMAAVETVLDQLDVPLRSRHSEAFAPDPSFVTELVGA